MNYHLKRSNRKTIALEITREAVVQVRAPLGMPQWEIDRFVARHGKWIETHLERVRARGQARPEPDAARLEVWRSAARETLPGKVEHYARVMGLTPTAVKITTAKTRFGSCSPKNGLCFSCRLMGYPMEAVDYVVVHELAHIVHKNHGKDFYALVASVLPDYQTRRAMLKG